MGIWTFAQLKSDALFRSQRTISDDDFLGRLVNSVLLDITVNEIDFPELDKTHSFSTVESQIAYTLPTNIYFYRKPGGRRTDTDYRGRLLPLTRTEYLGKTDYDTDAMPSHYLMYGGELLIYPSPDGVYACEIDYREKPATLTGTSTTTIGEEWDEAVVLGTIAKIYQALQEHEKFLVANNDFVQYMRRRSPVETVEKMSPTPLGVAWGEEDLS